LFNANQGLTDILCFNWQCWLRGDWLFIDP